MFPLRIQSWAERLSKGDDNVKNRKTIDSDPDHSGLS